MASSHGSSKQALLHETKKLLPRCEECKEKFRKSLSEIDSVEDGSAAKKFHCHKCSAIILAEFFSHCQRNSEIGLLEPCLVSDSSNPTECQLQDDFKEMKSTVMQLHEKICNLEEQFSLKEAQTENLFSEFDNLKAQMHKLKQDFLKEPSEDLRQKFEKDEIEIRSFMKQKHSGVQSSSVTERKEIDKKISETLKVRPLDDEIQNLLLEKRTEFIWKVTEVEKLLQKWKKNGEGSILSDLFETREFGLKMKAKLEYGKGGIHLYCCYEGSEETTAAPPSIYFQRRMAILMDQGEGYEPKKDWIRVKEQRFGKEEAKKWMDGFWGWYDFAPFELLERGSPYVNHDTVFIRILIEPLITLWRSFISNDGTFLWVIDNYFKKRKDARAGLIECLRSDYFYSSPRGYRMQIVCYFLSDRHMRMCVEFLRGEWDDYLPSKFPHKTTLKILDQKRSVWKCHLIQSKESESTNFYSMEKFPEYFLYHVNYTMHNRLVVNVTVEAIADGPLCLGADSGF